MAEKKENNIPEFFRTWDDALNKGLTPGYYEVDELCEIADIYLSEGQIEKAKQTINYAFKFYQDNEELIYEILLLLNDYEMWNDLLILAEKYKDLSQIWPDGHKLSALLHLGMEEDAFLFFKKLKKKYAENEENRSIIYQAMAEALYEVDLFDASIDVLKEAIGLINNNDIDFLWLQLQNYASLENKEKVLEIGSRIQKLSPLDPDTWSRLGNTYKDVGETEKSIEAFEFSLSLGNIDSNDLLSLIYAYEKNGNINKALEKIDEYLFRNPDSYVVQLMAANYCSQMHNWERALTYVTQAISLLPEMDSLYLYQADFLVRIGEYKKAIIALQEGIEKTGDNDGALSKELELLRQQYRS
jgi:tetratricopeptide (TPR) repeat protein